MSPRESIVELGPWFHRVPKWIPTTRCLEDMLHFVGYRRLEPLADYGERDRAMYLCYRQVADSRG